METRKIKLLIVNNTPDENPSYIVRNKLVADELNRRGHRIDCRIKGAKLLKLEDYDGVVFNRFYEGTLLKEITALQAMGKKIIYETDDNYEAINETHPFHKIKDYGVLSSRELAMSADAVTCSTNEIRNWLKPYASGEIYVIPNSIDFGQYPLRKKAGDKVRVGFQGSNIHSSDLLIVVDAIVNLKKELDFDFYIFGIDDKPLKELYKFCLEYKENWQWVKDFKILYEKLQTIEYTHIPTQKYADYRNELSKLDLDIGICPLAENEFNQSKSCLKYYEYVAVGTTVLASNVVPYVTEMYPEDLCKNRYIKWYSKLKRLIMNEGYRRERYIEQANWVRESRNIRKVADQWESIYQLILKDNKNEKGNDSDQVTR